VASAPGEEYNLPVGTRIEIENEAFGNQPKLLYGIVAEAISGGSTKQVKVVTEGDIDQAYKNLAQDLLNQARADLIKENSDFKLLDNAFVAQFGTQTVSHQVGAETAEFTAQTIMHLRAVVYDESQVIELIAGRIKRLLPKNKELQENDQRLTTYLMNLNVDTGQALLVNHYEGQIVFKLDALEITEKVRGKSVAEIREILLSQPEIGSIEVKLSPFWVKSAPKIRSKISVNIQKISP